MQVSGRTRRPRSRVQRIRRWLLIAAVVFASLLAGLIGYTRYRALRARLNLPKQLGIDIKSEANGFTISRSGKDGRPLFTVHAAKAIQHRDGITTLHDVAVTIYGPPGSNRTDSIRGGEFDYDQTNQILRAMGDTLLDVGIAEGANVPANAKRLTMQGRGLVFLQKLGVASTKEQIRFQYGASQGEAVGADYDMDTGLLTLQHDVHLHSMENGHPKRIDAESAELNRDTRVATLQNATLTDADDSMQAPHIVAALRSAPDEHAGTLEKVDASGGVTLRSATGQRVQAPQLHADLTVQNRLAQVILQGGVRLQDEQTNANAQRALVRFSNGQAEHLTLTGQARILQNAGPGISRTLEASQIESSLQNSHSAHLAPGEIRAIGSARLVLLQPSKQPGHAERTELSSPTLVAHTSPSAHSTQLQDLQANQGAQLVQDDGMGTVRTSISKSLFAAFAASNDPKQPSALESVVQQGDVSIHETRAAAAQPVTSARSASRTDATAERADYQAATNLLVLTGTPHVSSDGLQLSATRITVHRDSGDADASGAVRGSIQQASAAPAVAATHGSGPTQFAGDAVHLTHGTGAILLQGGNTDARLWSITGQVEAPTIQADQKTSTLHAFSSMPGAGVGTVRTVLMQPTAANHQDSDKATQSPTRIFSHDLLYHGSTAGRPGTADFRGGIRILQGDDVITADSATATLQPGATPSAGKSAAPGTMLASGVQTIVAIGHVHVQQGARTATGSRLLYTASTRAAVLTGAPGALPVVHDPMQGTLTGTELTLHLGQGKGDNQVEVSGAPNTPVHTELEVPEKGSGPASQGRSRPGRKSRPTP